MGGGAHLSRVGVRQSSKLRDHLDPHVHSADHRCVSGVPRSSCVLQVTVLFAGQHISKSPFEVEIGMAQGDSSKATAQGPGLEPSGNIANKTTYFDVYTAGGDRRQHHHVCDGKLCGNKSTVLVRRWRWRGGGDRYGPLGQEQHGQV